MDEELRIKFYGDNDMGAVWYLPRITEYFTHWDEKTASADINAVLELYNIKKILDAHFRPVEWTELQYEDYKNKCKQIPGIVGRFCGSLTDDNLQENYKSLHRQYSDDFWQLISRNKAYQRIKPQTIEKIMADNESAVWSIVRNKELVKFYGQCVAKHLELNNQTAEKLIETYLATHELSNETLYFPDELTQEQRSNILAAYLDREDENFNHVDLLSQAQSTNTFPVSDRLRLKAKKRREMLRQKMLSNGVPVSIDISVSFKSIPDGNVEETLTDREAAYSYSIEWIEENQDYPTLLNNFIFLFKYVDSSYRCTFISLKSELSVFEHFLGLKGDRDYEIGFSFNTKQTLSTFQMLAYIRQLERLNIQVESVFKWFFENYLKSEFHAEGFIYNPPSNGTTYVEKCKLISSAIDGVLKQFRLYCEDGYVDRELLEMSSGHIVFSEIGSVMKNKYAYVNSTELDNEMALLFSDQTIMHFTQKTGGKYPTLSALLLAEHLTLEDFQPYQQSNLKWLVERQVIYTDIHGFLHLNLLRAFILKDLYQHEVICPTYYDKTLKKEVSKLIAAGDLLYESTLFSKPEQSYLNYVLNKSEFSNGMDLRNKYIHDTNSLNENIQHMDYITLLKIMVLIIIKINEELRARTELYCDESDFSV